jgi:hypothetical protein
MAKPPIPKVNWTIAPDLVALIKEDADAEFMRPTQKANQIIRAYYKSIGRIG